MACVYTYKGRVFETKAELALFLTNESSLIFESKFEPSYPDADTERLNQILLEQKEEIKQTALDNAVVTLENFNEMLPEYSYVDIEKKQEIIGLIRMGRLKTECQ